MCAVAGFVSSAIAKNAIDSFSRGLTGLFSPGFGKYRKILLFLLLHGLFSGTLTWCWGEEVLPIRLVALIDQDDQGERIGFPIALFYDYWSSETYLISSTGRITIYDQKFFPVASFGKGRGVVNPTGLAVDRRGRIYVCQEAGGSVTSPRLVVYNQAFFPIQEVVFANIPELAGFTAGKVAVSESGEIYLSGHKGPDALAGVAVLTPEGKFSRILLPPENDAWRQAPKKEAASADKAQDKGLAPDESAVVAESSPIPSGLKPKSASARREEVEEEGQMGPAYISDIKIDHQGRIYLLSRETSKIYVLNAKEEYLFKFGEKGGVNGKLSNPVSLGIDLERRTIYVCDYMRHTILCYDYDSGNYVFEFGGRGIGPLWFNFPNNIEVDQRGQVVVSDLFNRRLQVIDTSMDERRPLAGLLPFKLAPGTKPGAEVVQVAKDLPVPPTESLASVPVPAAPGPATLAQLGEVLAPGSVLPPILPAGIVGVRDGALTQVPLTAMMVPPPRARTDRFRELTPRLVKKTALSLAPLLQIVAFSPVLSPRRFANPASVRFASEKVARSPRHLGDEPGGVLQTFKALPAAVGVYGPVASTLGVGSRLLSTNR